MATYTTYTTKQSAKFEQPLKIQLGGIRKCPRLIEIMASHAVLTPTNACMHHTIEVSHSNLQYALTLSRTRANKAFVSPSST